MKLKQWAFPVYIALLLSLHYYYPITYAVGVASTLLRSQQYRFFLQNWLLSGILIALASLSVYMKRMGVVLGLYMLYLYICFNHAPVSTSKYGNNKVIVNGEKTMKRVIPNAGIRPGKWDFPKPGPDASLTIAVSPKRCFLLFGTHKCGDEYGLYGCYDNLEEAVFNYLSLLGTDGYALNKYINNEWQYPTHTEQSSGGSESLHFLYIREIEFGGSPHPYPYILYSVIREQKCLMRCAVMVPDVPCLKELMCGESEDCQLDFNFTWNPIVPFMKFNF